MYRYAIMIMALSLCIMPKTRTQAQPKTDSGVEKKAGTLIMTLSELKVDDKTINVQYNIENGSDHEVWVCDSVDVYAGCHLEVYLAEEDQTLRIRRQLDVPAKGVYWVANPHGRYVCLRAGKTQTESLSLPLPVCSRHVYGAGRQVQGIEHAKRLTIDIGYYAGDMPGMIRGVLTEAERLSNTRLDHDLEITNKRYFGGLMVRDLFGGLLHFNELNEGLRSRDEEVLIPYTHQALKGENVLRITIDGLLIPCKEEKEWPPQGRIPYLTPWSRVEIQYQPSMLEYFFPYAGQQSLLSPAEAQYLRSLKTIVDKNQEHLKSLAYDVSKGYHGGVVAERSTAHVTCYRDSERLSSFTVYDNMSIETEEKQWFWYRRGLQSLKELTPQIQPFYLRVRCADNLKDLWHRFRLYHVAEKKRLKDSFRKSETVYPIPSEWCDLMVGAYRSIGMPDKNIMRPYKCPSASEGKSNYAMNPNCEFDSAPDTVLLFEAKAGWNQHGGPELFTFDNHKPKGGCVLLNDGTVKFIRTKEELQQLRWK